MKIVRFFLIILAILAAPLAQAQPFPGIDCSGTIAAGGTSQVLMTFSGPRRGFVVMNLSTDKLCFSFVGAAACDTAGSFSLNPATTGAIGTAGGSYTGLIINNQVTIVGATTGDKFSCLMW